MKYFNVKHLTIITMCICSIVLFSCKGNTAKEKTTTSKENTKIVNVKNIFNEENNETQNQLVLNGEVVCDETKMGKVFAPFDAKCLKLNVQIGDRVYRNQVLAVLQGETSEQLAKEIKENEALLKVSERKLLQSEQMYKSGLLSEKEFTEIQEENSVLKAEKQRLMKTSSLYGVSKSSSTTEIKAPCDGYVVSKNVFQGSFVNKEDAEPMFVISDIDRVWILADVYSKDIHKVRENQSAIVKISAYNDTSFASRVDCVYPVLEKDSKTLKIRLKVENKDRKLRPGMFANVVL